MGLSYKSQAECIAWIEMVGAAVLLLLFLCGAAILLFDPNLTTIAADMDAKDPNWRHNMHNLLTASSFKKIILLAPIFLYFMSEIALGIYLLRAVEKMNYKKLRTWYVITVTYAIIMTVLLLPTLLLKTNIEPEFVAFLVLGFFFTGYSLFVVRQLRNEIKANTLPSVMQVRHPYQDAFPNYPEPPPSYPVATEKQFMKI